MLRAVRRRGERVGAAEIEAEALRMIVSASWHTRKRLATAPFVAASSCRHSSRESDTAARNRSGGSDSSSPPEIQASPL